MKFDRAELKDADGTTIRTLTWQEFWDLPLAERVTHLSSGCVKFFLNNHVLSPRDAIKR